MDRAKLIIENIQELVEVTDDIKSLINNSIKEVLKYEHFDQYVEIGVTIVNNKGIKEINKEQRCIDEVTDVLSFPMLEFDSNQNNIIDNYSKGDYNYDDNALLMGDIIISLEKAVQQSEEYNHSFEREVGFLIVHSMLHLLGYDHVEKVDELIMRDKEEKILDILRLQR